MAKSKFPVSSKVNMNFVSILRGEFLLSDDFKNHWKLIVEMVICYTLIILAGHLVNSKILKINRLKDEIEELRSQNAFIQSKLINIKLESEIEKKLAKDTIQHKTTSSLRALENHPLKIVLKLDKNNHVTK